MRAKRSLGQNFLQDPSVIARIVDALGDLSGKTVVEIGPGQGALTERLVAAASKVYAIEFDRDMVAILEDRFSGDENFTLINADALTFDFASIADPSRPVKLAANLPYNISTPILQNLAKQRDLFSNMVLMFQREVVERMTAAPGGKERGFLSVIVEDAFDTEYLFDVPPRAFLPVPKVWSSVVRLTPKAAVDTDEALFRKVVSASFAQKRKTLSNNLKAIVADPGRVLSTARIDGRRRAETLDMSEWRVLTEAIADEPGSG